MSFKWVFKCILVLLPLIFSLNSRACNSSISLDSITLNGSGNYVIDLTLCIGGGVGGATGETGEFLFAFTSSDASFSIISFTDTIISDTTSNEFIGIDVGAQAAFNASDAIYYSNNFSNLFTCVSSVVICGSSHQDCKKVRFVTNVYPDSLRVFGIEGAGNPFGGCFPSASMHIDFAILLPATLNTFFVECGRNKNIINWQTISEENLFSFELQKSSDTSNFNTIHSTKAKTNYSYTPQKYSFEDIQNNSTPAYYRLKMIDVDGSVSYSKIIDSYCKRELLKPIIFISDKRELHLSFEGSFADSYQVEIYDNVGRKILTRSITDSNKSVFPLPNLPLGVYFISINFQERGENLSQRFIIE